MPDIVASRKFIDLIYQVSARWANWDPPSEIKVGDYGTIDKETGELDVEGNIYDPAFQTLLEKQDLKIDLSSCQPKPGGVEDDWIMHSSGVKRGNFSMKPEFSLLNLASASCKAEFQFQEGKRGAVLVMHKPEQESIPRGKMLTSLYKVNELRDKYLVTSRYTCPGYCIFLSDTSGEKIALALTASAPIPAAVGLTAGGTASMDWWTSTQAAFIRKAVDKAGQYRYTPLYTLNRKKQNFLQVKFKFRAEEKEEEEETEDDLWPDCTRPWGLLDEDGIEEPPWEETDE